MIKELTEITIKKKKKLMSIEEFKLDWVSPLVTNPPVLTPYRLSILIDIRATSQLNSF